MSDKPPGYFLGPKDEHLLAYREEPRLYYSSSSGDAPRKAKKKGSMRKGRMVKEMLRERDGERCHYCTRPLIFGHEGQPTFECATIEHIVPRAQGGSNQKSNLVLACYECNHKLDSIINKCICRFCTRAVRLFEEGINRAPLHA